MGPCPIRPWEKSRKAEPIAGGNPRATSALLYQFLLIITDRPIRAHRRILKSLYPADHEAIGENCGAVVTFGHTSMGMSRQIADMLGDISAETLFAMTGGQLAVHIARQPTAIARRLDYLTDSLFAGRFDANPPYRGPAPGPAGDISIQRRLR
ncbi:MAG: hypothetical protein USCAAHI_00879 [Beijerinckiaceae bacterium]|nr:MAG: hypothetical protein USCAAHI_00879 [Beijerinckiaceae bacterium]